MYRVILPSKFNSDNRPAQETSQMNVPEVFNLNLFDYEEEVSWWSKGLWVAWSRVGEIHFEKRKAMVRGTPRSTPTTMTYVPRIYIFNFYSLDHIWQNISYLQIHISSNLNARWLIFSFTCIMSSLQGQTCTDVHTSKGFGWPTKAMVIVQAKGVCGGDGRDRINCDVL